MFFGLQLGYLLFVSAGNTSKVLQGKDISVQEAFSTVNVHVTKSCYQRQRQDDAFNKFYESVVKNAHELQIGEPMLPRYRKAPRRCDNGSPQFTCSDPRSYYRHSIQKPVIFF